MDLSMLVGPAVGAVIGYGTNWIAIKMLFRPIKPIKIGKFTLPFTPGIIPKRKGELATAIGNMVGNTLFTSEDMKNMLLSEEVENMIVSNVISGLNSETMLREMACELLDEEKYEEVKEKVNSIITEKIKEGLIKANVSEIIIEEGKKAIQSKVTGMLKMFVTENTINSIMDPMGVQIEIYIKDHSDEKIVPIVAKEISELEQKSMKELTQNVDSESLKDLIRNVYQNFVEDYITKLLEKLEIAKVVEDKINAMDVLELEKMILTVMKRELGAIVNLGAFIGLILGCLNLIV